MSSVLGPSESDLPAPASTSAPRARAHRWTDPDAEIERAGGDIWSVWRGGNPPQQLRRLAAYLENDDRLVVMALDYEPHKDRLLALLDVDVYEPGGDE